MLRLFFRILLCLFIVGGIQFSSMGEVQFGETLSAQSKKKKKSSSKKRSSSKKKKSSKKRSSSKKKRSSKKKKSSSKKQKATKPESTKPLPIVNKGPQINVAAYADELYQLSSELEASNKEMAKATRYIHNEKPKKKLGNIESLPFLSTGDYETDARNNPNNIYIQRQLGLHYENVSNWEGAKDVYLRQIKKHPANPDAHFYLGSFYAQLGEYEKARQSFEEALELNPDHKGTIDAMAMYTNSPDQKTLSEQILGMSSKRAPNGPAQKLTTIRQRLVEGNYTDALRLCEEGQKNFPSHNGFLQLTGETQLAMGNVEAAKSAFQRSIKLNAKDKSSHSSLANLYFDLGKYVYAALSFSDVIYLDPDDSDSRYMQGLSYFKAKEWGRAAAAWEDLLHYKPDNEVVRVLLPQTYYILAIEYNRLGNPSMGKQSFKNALSVNPNSNQWLASSMSTLGGYYREKRMYRESLAAYQEVIELSPSDAEAYLGIGLTYWNMNEKDLAISSWQKSMLIKPENNESQGWLILSKQES